MKSLLDEAVDQLNKVQPLYSRMPKEFVKIAAALTGTPGFHAESKIIGELRGKHKSTFGTKYKPYKKMLEILHFVVRTYYSMISVQL